MNKKKCLLCGKFYDEIKEYKDIIMYKHKNYKNKDSNECSARYSERINKEEENV